MIEAGFVLAIISALLACAVPAERALAVRKQHRERPMIGPALRSAFPIVVARPDVETLVAQADDGLAKDALSRGVAGLAETYTRAARRD